MTILDVAGTAGATPPRSGAMAGGPLTDRRERAWDAGARPAGTTLKLDLDSTAIETYGLQKQGCKHFTYLNTRGYHPLLAVLAETGEVAHSRLREGKASAGRGAAGFARHALVRLGRLGLHREVVVRADSGFYSEKVVHHPLAGRMCGHPGEVNAAAADLKEKEDVEPAQPDRVHAEEVACEDLVGNTVVIPGVAQYERIIGSLVTPGEYRVRGLVRQAIAPRYEFSVYSGDQSPPWDTQSGHGGWLANRTPSAAALYLPGTSGTEPACFCRARWRRLATVSFGPISTADGLPHASMEPLHHFRCSLGGTEPATVRLDWSSQSRRRNHLAAPTDVDGGDCHLCRCPGVGCVWRWRQDDGPLDDHRLCHLYA